MTNWGNVAKTVLDVITPESQTERIIFRKFLGEDLAAAANGDNGKTDPKPDVTVKLKVNPASIQYSNQKIIQKIQTAAPGRFVVFDWGTDLTVLAIAGNTGNMLPEIMQSGFNPLNPTLEDLAMKIVPGKPLGAALNPLGSSGAAIAQRLMMGKLSYFELLDMSPKYKAFKSLESLYMISDADRDVLTLEMGQMVYRGYFNSFDFSQEAENPWNWKYNVSWTTMQDLSQFTRRGDDTYGNNSSIIPGV